MMPCDAAAKTFLIFEAHKRRGGEEGGIGNLVGFQLQTQATIGGTESTNFNLPKLPYKLQSMARRWARRGSIAKGEEVVYMQQGMSLLSRRIPR